MPESLRLCQSIYSDERMDALVVSNPHFDMRDEFDAAVRSGGVTEAIERRMHANFSTAVGEDVLRCGSFCLELYQGDDGRYVLTTEDHREFGDITQISLRGAKKRRAEGKPYGRELAEVLGMRELRRMCLEDSDGATFVHISPPGPPEDGYLGTSLTYIYRLEGELPSQRKVHVTFYKNALSLEGHARILRMARGDDISELSELSSEFFVRQPIDISDNPMLQRASDVIAAIDAVTREGLVVPGIGLGEELSQETFESYRPQIDAAASFLIDVLREHYAQSAQLDQEGLSRLELAYSFARRAVSRFAAGYRLISAVHLLDDYRRKLAYDGGTWERFDSGGESRFVQEAIRFQRDLMDRYGSLKAERVGGLGCPAGVLVSLGFSVDGFSLPTYGEVSFGDHESSWSYHYGSCRVCRSEHTLVGPCHICKNCERTFQDINQER